MLRVVAVVLLAVIGMATLLGCAEAPVGNGARGPSLSPQDIEAVGAFEVIDSSAARVDAKSALERARSADFGRPGDPETSLVRATAADAGVPVGSLVWLFHWGGLHEEYGKGFPPLPGGTPQATVLVYTDYWLLVDASTGMPISSTQH